MRFIIARFYSSRNVVCKFCRLMGKVGYVILGLLRGFCISLMIILLGGN